MLLEEHTVRTKQNETKRVLIWLKKGFNRVKQGFIAFGRPKKPTKYKKILWELPFKQKILRELPFRNKKSCGSFPSEKTKSAF